MIGWAGAIRDFGWPEQGAITLSVESSKGRRNAEPAGGMSGRLFIVMLVAAILIFWGLLTLGFRAWKAGYDQRAVVGRETARHIRPLVQSRPDTVSLAQWEDTVDHAEAMLIAVTGSNLLNIQQMQQLTEQVDTLVAQAKADPNRGPALLYELWESLAKRAGPVADIYGRPQLVKSAARSR